MADDDDADLFDYAHARPSDPATSHEAVPVNLSEQAWRVLKPTSATARCRRRLPPCRA
jgi:hypothetical protein